PLSRRRIHRLGKPTPVVRTSWSQANYEEAVSCYARVAQTLKNITRPVRAFCVGADKLRRASQRTWDKPALSLPDKPSIAVLPFQNMSADPEQDYFADGIVEDVITGLSRINWLFVIARNSSFIYKGKA